jgi:transposase, IS5 family
MKHFHQPSFSAQFVYGAIPSDHYLVKVDELVDWERYGAKIRQHGYKWQGDLGQPMYNPAILLKMLFLCHLYNISERECEEQVNFNIVMKYFCDLVPEERSPDHSTLSLFKNRILRTNAVTKKNLLKDIFDDIVVTAARKWLQPSSMRIIDAGHIVSHVNTDKENFKKGELKKKNETNETNEKNQAAKQKTEKFTPRDPDAAWWCKKSITVDKDKKIPLYFQWYKEHTSYDPYKNLITEIIVTSGEVYDGHFLQPLLESEKKNKHMQATKTYKPHPILLTAADKGYDDGENHEYLVQASIHDAIILKKSRTQKKDANKERWIDLEKSAFYKFGKKKRPSIEKVYWDGKHWHWLEQCKYLGLEKTKMQAYLTATIFNLKSITKQLFWVTFRNQKYHYGGS